MDTDNTTEITQRQQMINEVVDDLVATRTDIVLWLKWDKIMKTEPPDMTLVLHCHKAVGQRLVKMVKKMNERETPDPECPLSEWLSVGDIFRKVEYIVHLFEQGEEPQNTEPDGYREWQEEWGKELRG
jgi:hypothetical protein